MPYREFDRSALRIPPLAEREDRAFIEADHVKPEEPPRPFSKEAHRVIDAAVARIVSARAAGRV